MENETNNAADSVDTIMRQWQRERPDLDVSSIAVIGRIRRCATVLAPRIAEELKRFDLNDGEFDVLSALRRAGEPHMLSPTQLFSSLMITSGTITHRLKQLEQRGLISRENHPHDNRSLLVKLTPAGKALIDQAIEAHLANQNRLLANIPPKTRQVLSEHLKVLLNIWEA